MFEFVGGLAIGLFLGWNFLPQPAFVKNFYDKTVAKVKSWF